MAVRAAGVRDLGGPSAEAAVAVRADQQLAALVLDQQKQLAAVRAGLSGLIVVGIGRVAGLDLLHEPGRVGPHFCHEGGIPLLTLGDPGQTVLPAGGQLGASQLLRHQIDKLNALRGGDQALAGALDIKGGKELFDDVRPGRRGAEPGGLLQDLAELLVRDLADRRMLHRGQQGGLGVAGRGCGLPLGEAELLHRQALTLLQIGKALFLLLGVAFVL